jgi:hypothetical protein
MLIGKKRKMSIESKSKRKETGLDQAIALYTFPSPSMADVK